MDPADDHGPDGVVIAPYKLIPGAVESVADLVRTWLRVLSSPGESDRTADHR